MKFTKLHHKATVAYNATVKIPKLTKNPGGGYDRWLKSIDKSKYTKTDKINVAYPAYLKYIKLVDDPYDYISHGRLIDKINSTIVNRILTTNKSFRLPYLGILRIMYRKNVGSYRGTVKSITMDWNRQTNLYIKRYSLKKSRFIYWLIRYFNDSFREDFTKKDYIITNSRL